MDALQAKQRVAAGAALLDERYPGWEHVIDERDLKLHDECRCILGQLYGGYYAGVARLKLQDGGYVERGFFATCDMNLFERFYTGQSPAQVITENYQLLEQEWKRVIQCRRLQQAQHKAQELVSA